MATYTTPTTRASGFLVTASVWNTDIVENIKYFKDAPVFDTAAIIGAATTAGIRLDLESGVLAVREGDDSGYGPMRSGILYVVGSAPAATPTWQSADSAIVSGTTNNVLQLHSGTNSGSQAVAFSVGSTRSKAGYGYDNANDALYFTTNSTERMRLTSGGVLHPSTNDAAALGNGTYQWSDLYLASGALIDFANNNMRITHGSGTLNISGGNVGIGAASPSRPLEIGLNGSTSTATVFEISTSTGTNAQAMSFGGSGSGRGYIGRANSAGATPDGPTLSAYDMFVAISGANNIAFCTNTAERLRITSGGNVAIAATAKLYLDGVAGTGDTYLVESAANDVSLVVGGSTKIQALYTSISVSTSATTILADAGGLGSFCIINGESGGNRFCDLVLASTSVSPTVVASFTSFGSPAARTYSRSSSALQLAMASGTYTITSVKIGS